jgi:hypothetical protein
MKKTLLLKQCLFFMALSGGIFASAQTVVVSDCDLNGWKTYTEPTGTLAFVSGPATPPLGKGSIQFSLGTDGNGKAAIGTNEWAGTPLSTLTQLFYATYVQNNISGQAPALEIVVDNNGDGTADDRLVFEPVYQTGIYPGVIQNGGMVLLNTWQTWNGIPGGWWAASDETAGPSTYTLASYLQAHPTATIAFDPIVGGVILTGGGGNTWNNFIGYADALTIGTSEGSTTYDFEACTQGVQKLTVCHKGHTLSIPQSALQGHLNHGDQIGACATSGTKAASPVSETALPAEHFKVSNYPNPLTNFTRIQYSLPQSSTVSLKVFDATGRQIATLVNGALPAGHYFLSFDASRLDKGVYYYTLQAQYRKGHIIQTRSMTIIR